MLESEELDEDAERELEKEEELDEERDVEYVEGMIEIFELPFKCSNVIDISCMSRPRIPNPQWQNNDMWFT